MRILSWNVQCGKACNGTTDITKTAQHIRSFGELDVICLQEIARNMREYCASDQIDQNTVLQSAFSEYTPVWGSGFSWPATAGSGWGRREFGNLTLLKTELLDAQIHPLPRPATPGKRQMQRVAVETVVRSRIGNISIINSHLAFHDPLENQLQVERLHALEIERQKRMAAPGETIAGCYQQAFEAKARILCGDFNFGVDSMGFQYLKHHQWLDCWNHYNHDTPHKPTCGIFDTAQWPEGPHCRDFYWLSDELKDVKGSMIVDTKSSLSDHQPIVLELSI